MIPFRAQVVQQEGHPAGCGTVPRIPGRRRFKSARVTITGDGPVETKEE